MPAETAASASGVMVVEAEVVVDEPKPKSRKYAKSRALMPTARRVSMCSSGKLFDVADVVRAFCCPRRGWLETMEEEDDGPDTRKKRDHLVQLQCRDPLIGVLDYIAEAFSQSNPLSLFSVENATSRDAGSARVLLVQRWAVVPAALALVPQSSREKVRLIHEPRSAGSLVFSVSCPTAGCASIWKVVMPTTKGEQCGEQDALAASCRFERSTAPL
ncbi:hypothetical protein DFH94DRAFT_686773 [Russula ochroleuca]|uniref:Uncharacterized protein n=1 Tax=Russula ochroleuca TaxID=152965 RepID=A0A9P5JV63_9AGAM|nr:hypothetical protein DFH94DRAFT_686773 [Russula ochroleuca]